MQSAEFIRTCDSPKLPPRGSRAAPFRGSIRLNSLRKLGPHFTKVLARKHLRVGTSTATRVLDKDGAVGWKIVVVVEFDGFLETLACLVFQPPCLNPLRLALGLFEHQLRKHDPLPHIENLRRGVGRADDRIKIVPVGRWSVVGNLKPESVLMGAFLATGFNVHLLGWRLIEISSARQWPAPALFARSRQ